MTRDTIQTAINERLPFEIKMADDEKYRVTDRYQIAIGKTYVMVLDSHDGFHILPLLTMTGISYLKTHKKS